VLFFGSADPLALSRLTREGFSAATVLAADGAVAGSRGLPGSVGGSADAQPDAAGDVPAPVPAPLLMFSSGISVADRMHRSLPPSHASSLPASGPPTRATWRALIAVVALGRRRRLDAASLGENAPTAGEGDAARFERLMTAAEADGFDTVEIDGPGDEEETLLCRAGRGEADAPAGEVRALPCFLVEYEYWHHAESGSVGPAEERPARDDAEEGGGDAGTAGSVDEDAGRASADGGGGAGLRATAEGSAGGGLFEKGVCPATGRDYWFNAATGESTYDDPARESGRAAGAENAERRGE
jgi:hypothetical protein